MRLVFAIVRDSDASALLDAFAERHIGATRLASTGGFLREGNTTFLIGVEDERVQEVIGIIAECCPRRVEASPQFTPGMGQMPSAGVPVEVEAGGAIVFVTEVEDFIRI
ncbi:MAG: cyclic-di-AMP receptor [Bacillota bacterium]|nr:cyclic-di-AMP receptor [Bacillota bacterium]